MKRFCVLISILGIFCSLSAHEASVPLDKGQLSVSYIFYPRHSMSRLPIFTMDSEGEIISFSGISLSENFFSMSGQGDFINLEYAIINPFSIGIRSSFLGFAVNGFKNKDWNYCTSFYARFNLISHSLVRFHTVSELWCNPLFSNQPITSPESRYFVLYNTVSGNLSILNSKEKELELNTFIDLKVISTLMHPESRNRDLWLKGLELDQTKKDKIAVDISSGSRLAYAVGLDLLYKKMAINLAFHFPIMRLTKYGYSVELAAPSSDAVDFLLNNIQLTWSYRF